MRKTMKRRIAPLMFFAMFILMACNLNFALQVPIPFLEDGNPTPTQEIAALPTATPSGYIGVITVTGSLVNVRTEPSTTALSVGKVRAGTVLPLVHEGESWVRIDYHHDERWMLKALVRITYFE